MADAGADAEKLLRDACKDGLHPKAWTPEQIARTAFISAKGGSSLKDEPTVYQTKSLKQQVKACLFVAGTGLQAQSERLVQCIERKGQVAGINLQHDGTSMPVMFNSPDLVLDAGRKHTRRAS